MKNLDLIGEELFNKIRGRFPTVTIGNEEGVVTNVPNEARFFDFDFKEGDKNLGKVSVSIDDKSLSVMYSNNFVEGQDAFTKEKWYGFLKELRYFAKKRLLNFDTRDITKSNLNRRDYKFLANNTGDTTMSESKMYGTSKTSYQDVGTARLALRHSKAVNQELAHGRTQHVEAIYIESAEGERFKYPYRHLNGARAMARHVAEGGNAYDDFGKYIVSLSEELSKLRKFKNYMGRSGVMAEGLQDYLTVVHERIDTVKKTIEQLQKPSHYKTAFEGFEKPVFEDVPEDVAENWIDQLTIRQFNEELKDVFPYIYKLVNEKTKAKEIMPEDILGEGEGRCCKDCGCKEYHVNEKCDCPHDSNNHSGSWWIPISEYKAMKEETTDDFEQFKSWADDVVESGIVKEMHDDPQYKSWLKIYKKSPDAAEAHPKHAEFLKYYKSEKDDEQKEGDILNTLGPAIRNIHMADPQEKKLHAIMQKHEGNPEAMAQAGMDLYSDDPEFANWWRTGQHSETGKAFVKAAGLNEDSDAEEGNAFTMALKKAKDDDEDEMEVDGKKIPVTEFVLSLFDRETGQFPKGETAVLTAVEKDYGEQYINPAKQFIERIMSTYERYATPKQDDIVLDAESEGTVMEPTLGQEEAKELEDMKRMAGISI
jgi:hypothetical protein